jgi:hypothetical protein
MMQLARLHLADESPKTLDRQTTMTVTPEDMQPESVNSVTCIARTAFRVSLAVQGVAFLVLVFGDIGFDRPGRFGLDFGHMLLLAVIWFVASCVGFFAAFKAWQLGWGMLLLGAVFVQVVWVLLY